MNSTEVLIYIKNLAATNPVAAYILLFFNSALQVLFPPYPGDSLTVFAGYLSTLGKFNTPLLLLFILSGTYLSSVFLYLISLKFGQKIIGIKFVKKYFNINKIHKLENWFNKYGALAIIINKFIPGIGSLTLIAAGLFRLRPVPAFISIGIVTAIHNTFLFMGGRLTGDNINLIKYIVYQYKFYILLAFALISIIYFYIKYLLKRKRRYS